MNKNSAMFTALFSPATLTLPTLIAREQPAQREHKPHTHYRIVDTGSLGGPINRGGSARLLLETLDCCRVPHHIIREEFERDFTPQGKVFGTVNDPCRRHPACPEDDSANRSRPPPM